MEDNNETWLFVFFIIFWISNSQTFLEKLNSQAEAISVDNLVFSKAYSFYKSNSYDSCYVYSSKVLLKTNTLKERDILNYT